MKSDHLSGFKDTQVAIVESGSKKNSWVLNQYTFGTKKTNIFSGRLQVISKYVAFIIVSDRK